MEDKEIRPICLYKETCLDYKQGKRKCEDCIHNKEYWTEVQLRDMAQNIRRLKKENAELKTENETLKSQLDFEVQKKEVLESENERLKLKTEELENRMQTLDDETITVEITEDEFEKYKNLKTENARLKEEIKKLEDFIKSDGEIDHINHEYTYKLKQTLQEIKAIAKDNIIGCFSDKCDLADEILQKITKAESEG